MSFFDPQELYIHPQKKSHKGQVIRKKAVTPIYAIMDSDVKQAIKILTSDGYYVSPTPPDPPRPMDPFFRRSGYVSLNLTPTTPYPQQYSMSLSDVASTVYANMGTLPEDITHFYFQFELESFVLNYYSTGTAQVVYFGNDKIGEKSSSMYVNGFGIMVLSSDSDAALDLKFVDNHQESVQFANPVLHNNYLFFKSTENPSVIKDQTFFNNDVIITSQCIEASKPLKEPAFWPHWKAIITSLLKKV